MSINFRRALCAARPPPSACNAAQKYAVLAPRAAKAKRTKVERVESVD